LGKQQAASNCLNVLIWHSAPHGTWKLIVMLALAVCCMCNAWTDGQ